MATMAAVGRCVVPPMVTVKSGVKWDSRSVVEGLKRDVGVRKVVRGVRCIASEIGVAVTQSTGTQCVNQAEELLELWAKQPPASTAGSTEAVRRLFMWESVPKKEEQQVFSIYEINELDRNSPAFLPFSLINISKLANTHVMSSIQSFFSSLSGDHGIGDMVPFSNKLYDSTLQMRLGVTAGITIVVASYPGKGSNDQKKQKLFFPDRYEAMYTFYLGDLGHISAQGPFVTFEDTLLTITGGAGMFREAKGVIQLHNITPLKLFYTFHVRGVPELPKILTGTPVEPNDNVQPCRDAVLCKPGYALPNYTQ